MHVTDRGYMKACLCKSRVHVHVLPDFINLHVLIMAIRKELHLREHVTAASRLHIFVKHSVLYSDLLLLVFNYCYYIIFHKYIIKISIRANAQIEVDNFHC